MLILLFCADNAINVSVKSIILNNMYFIFMSEGSRIQKVVFVVILSNF